MIELHLLSLPVLFFVCSALLLVSLKSRLSVLLCESMSMWYHAARQKEPLNKGH